MRTLLKITKLIIIILFLNIIPCSASTQGHVPEPFSKYIDFFGDNNPVEVKFTHSMKSIREFENNVLSLYFIKNDKQIALLQFPCTRSDNFFDISTLRNTRQYLIFINSGSATVSNIPYIQIIGANDKNQIVEFPIYLYNNTKGIINENPWDKYKKIPVQYTDSLDNRIIIQTKTDFPFIKRGALPIYWIYWHDEYQCFIFEDILGLYN